MEAEAAMMVVVQDMLDITVTLLLLPPVSLREISIYVQLEHQAWADILVVAPQAVLVAL